MSSGRDMEKKLVCIICLKRFTLLDKDNGNKPNSNNFNGTSPGNTADPYTEFLLFVSRYFKLTSLTERFLERAKQAKVQNGEKTNLQAFCVNCGELVNSICKIYKELQVIQMFLVWKLGEVGELLKSSRNSMSNKLSKQVVSCLAKQINVKSSSPVKMFRKSLQFKCIDAQRKSMPTIPVPKGLLPEEWKFSYTATKEILIRLIVVFTLGSVKISNHSIVTAATDKTHGKRKNVAKRQSGRPTKIMKPSNDKTDQIAVKNEDEKIDVANDDENYEEAPKNIGNDLDWIGPSSPMSVRSVSSDNEDDTQQKTVGEPVRKIRRNLRGRRNVVVEAEEEGDANSLKTEVDYVGDIPKQKMSRKQQSTGKRRGPGRPPSSLPKLPKQTKDRRRTRLRTEIENKLDEKWSKVKLSCDVKDCDFKSVYRNPSILGNHLETIHEEGKPEVEKNIQCCYCPEKYYYQQTCDMHLRAKHTLKMIQGFKCDLEGCEEKPFVSMEELNEHLKTHLGQGDEKISFCEKCNWGFMRPELRDLHQLEHIKADPEDGTFRCPQCVENFARVSTLQRHFNQVHGLDLRPFQCEACDKYFLWKNSLQHHKQRYHSTKVCSRGKVKCDQCSLTFPEEYLFDLHLKGHTSFKCLEPGCEQKFNTNRKLQMHRTRDHVVKRDWICEICGHQFANKDYLTKHRKLHGEKKFPCEFCEAAFPRKTKLKSHLESKHNPNRVKSHVCSLCGKSYYTDTGLQYHTDSEHGTESEWNLKCPHCPRKFYRKLYLDKHLKICKGPTI